MDKWLMEVPSKLALQTLLDGQMWLIWSFTGEDVGENYRRFSKLGA
jgi:hypothetical protein